MPRHKRRLMSDINMVPFIDIVLVLLVAFMVTAPLMMQGVQVHLPKTVSEPLKADKDNVLVVSVKSDGTYYLNVGTSNEKAISLKDMVNSVEKIRRRAPETMILVKGDTNASYGKVITAMSGLQQAGITDIGLVTDPRDLQ